MEIKQMEIRIAQLGHYYTQIVEMGHIDFWAVQAKFLKFREPRIYLY